MQTFTGKQYLQIDIANSFGLDKTTWAERLRWFQQHEPVIAAGDDATLDALARTAEEPAQFLAGVTAYRKTLAGETTGYFCGLDATASGIQLLSLLSGCEQSARQCNLINTGRREDAYTNMHVHMDQLLGNKNSYPRKTVKQAGMTHFYGSKAEPRNAFGEDTPELAAFYQTIDELLPGANQLNYDLLGLWQPNVLAHEWTLPDGFDVKIKVMVTHKPAIQFLDRVYEVPQRVNAPKESGLSIGANIVHSIDGLVVREMGRRCNFDTAKLMELYLDLLEPSKHRCSTIRFKDLELLRVLEAADASGFLSAVVFEHLDTHNMGLLDTVQRAQVIDLIESLPSKSFPLLAIHDCFKFHANYGNDVREQYNNILAELAASEILSHIATQITGHAIKVNKLSAALPSHIRTCEYALS